jgi:hypothetical protein
MLAQQQQRQFRVTNASEDPLRRFLCPNSRHVRSAVGENALVVLNKKKIWKLWQLMKLEQQQLFPHLV